MRAWAVAALFVLMPATCQPAAPVWTAHATRSAPAADWAPHGSGDLVTDGDVLRTAWVDETTGRIIKLGGHGWSNRFHSVVTVSPPYRLSARIRVDEVLPRCGDVVDRLVCHTATWRPGVTIYPVFADDSNNVAVGFGVDRSRVNVFKEVGHQYGGVDGLMRPHYVDLDEPPVLLGRWVDIRVDVPECGRVVVRVDGRVVVDSRDPNPRWCADVHVGWRVDFHDVRFDGMQVVQL